MKEIPIKVFARQSLSVMLEQSLYEISLKECNGIMAATIIRDGVTIVSNRRVCAGMTVIPEGHLEEGNFVILTENGEIPYYTGFESTDVMVYLTIDETQELRLMVPTGPAPGSIPSGPLVDFNYKTGKLAYGMNLARATVGTYIQASNGELKTAAINVARFESNGLLIEPDSTNLLRYSSDLTNSIWGTNRATKTGGFTSPDGSNNAIKVIPTVDNNSHFMGQSITLSSPKGDYCLSFYGKAGEYKNVRLRVADSIRILRDTVVDLSSGKKVGGSMPFSIDNIGNGWFRISLVVTPGLSATSLNLSIWVYDNDLAPTFPGNGSYGVYIFGGQIELQPLNTSFIYTTNTTVNRSRDLLSLTQLGAKWLYREYIPLGGSLVKEFIPYAGELCPPGHLQKLKAWNRDLTTGEIKSLGVTNV